MSSATAIGSPLSSVLRDGDSWRHGRMSPSPLPPEPADSSRQDEDARLLRLVASGDRDAFARLYDRFSRPLFSIAQRVLNDPREAEDIVHDVFVALWEKSGSFESNRGSAFAWCVTMTRNRAIDRVRARKRRGELLSESVPSDLGYEVNEAGAGDSADDLWGKEKAAAVRAALANLPAEQRAALQLAYYSGLTQQEIAAKLREPLGTVKARIRRGLLKLREFLPSRL
ncbi:MAG TPA: sigma-70 family RNA polymerase sigma factor [Opitutaceae bacterium]